MWCLSRLLPLIIYGLIPEDNPDWQLFSDLMKIVDIIITPVIARETTFYLQILIKEYLQEFRNLYPNTRLIPKQHFMIHYPAQIRRCVIAGALIEKKSGLAFTNCHLFLTQSIQSGFSGGIRLPDCFNYGMLVNNRS